MQEIILPDKHDYYMRVNKVYFLAEVVMGLNIHFEAPLCAGTELSGRVRVERCVHTESQIDVAITTSSRTV
jgi:hypothetical protein